MPNRKPEIWKQARHQGKLINYEISSHGNFRNMTTGHDRSICKGRKYATVTRVTLPWKDKPTTLRISPLVAQAFLGPKPAGYQIDHVDGDSLNDYYENLEYVTQSENIRRSFANGSRSRGAGRSLSPQAYRIIKGLWEQGISQKDISRMTRVCNTRVSKIVNGQCHPRKIDERFLVDITVDWSARLETPSPMQKLTPEQAVEIYLSSDSSTVLAERFGVSQASISAIRCHRTWRDATRPYRLMP